MSEAIVVGSGPNGLACAVALARAGVRVTVLEAQETIGGGTQSSELTVPGLLHDHCSAVHPMGYGSPFLRSLALEDHGLQWRWPEVDLAHPLDDGSASVLLASIEDTAAGLGPDGRAWKRASVARPRSSRRSTTISFVRSSTFHATPSLWRFGLRALTPATMLARAFKTEQARARCSAASPPMPSAR